MHILIVMKTKILTLNYKIKDRREFHLITIANTLVQPFVFVYKTIIIYVYKTQYETGRR